MSTEANEWGEIRPFDEEAVRRFNEERLAWFESYAEQADRISDPDSVLRLAVEKARGAGLPSLSGLLVHVSGERHMFRNQARLAEKVAGLLYRALSGKLTPSALSEALGEEGHLLLNYLQENEE